MTPCEWCGVDYTTRSDDDRMRHWFTCVPPPGWKPSEAFVARQGEQLAESIVTEVERMEISGLADPLVARAAGKSGFAAAMRRVFAPAFERVYRKRRAAEAR